MLRRPTPVSRLYLPGFSPLTGSVPEVTSTTQAGPSQASGQVVGPGRGSSSLTARGKRKLADAEEAEERKKRVAENSGQKTEVDAFFASWDSPLWIPSFKVGTKLLKILTQMAVMSMPLLVGEEPCGRCQSRGNKPPCRRLIFAFGTRREILRCTNCEHDQKGCSFVPVQAKKVFPDGRKRLDPDDRPRYDAHCREAEKLEERYTVELDAVQTLQDEHGWATAGFNKSRGKFDQELPSQVLARLLEERQAEVTFERELRKREGVMGQLRRAQLDDLHRVAEVHGKQAEAVGLRLDAIARATGALPVVSNEIPGFDRRAHAQSLARALEDITSQIGASAQPLALPNVGGTGLTVPSFAPGGATVAEVVEVVSEAGDTADTSSESVGAPRGRGRGNGRGRGRGRGGREDGGPTTRQRSNQSA